MPDHIHLLLSIPPKYSVSNTIGCIKGKNEIRIHRDLLKTKKLARVAFLGTRFLCEHSWHRRLSENGYFPQSWRQAQILILEILQCITAVKIFAFLELAKNLSFPDSLLYEDMIRQDIEKGITWD